MSVITVDDQPVTVEQTPVKRWVRHPGDVIRIVVALGSVGAAYVVLRWGNDFAAGLQQDVIDIEPDLPKLLLALVTGIYAVLLTLLPPTLLAWLIWRRHWKLYGIYLLTTLAAALLFSFIGDWVAAQVPPPPASTTGNADIAAWISCADPAWVASLAAALTVTGPWISRHWYRLGWVMLVLLLPMRLLLGAGAPTGRLFALAVGWAIGSAALLIFGAPSRAPSAQAIVRGLRSAGLQLTELTRAGVDARGSTPYFATAADGQRYFVKTLGRDERSADLMFRIFRYFRLRDVGDEEPFSSLRRAVEHEAMTSVWAERAGVRTPPLVACVELVDGSMCLVYGLVQGRSLDSVPAEDVTDEFLRGMWEQVALLRRGRVSHRDLRRANVFMTGDGEPMIIDFGFGEVSADDGQLNQDVAQLVLSTAIDVGPQRAVAAAVAVLGPQAVADAAPRLQLPALSGATQTALRHNKGLLAQTQDEVKQQTGIDGSSWPRSSGSRCATSCWW